ncbi:MAG: 2-aminoethylphosphonate--pyruvate transaminase [Planctomycetota bacterium]|nr:2-aminoethylphosphonate--pyruvate transaminase [Planctomycetota bacterium]
MDDDIPYLLLTPGPLTTSKSVRRAMQSDYSTWDVDYNERVEFVRNELVRLAAKDRELHTSVLMQGSGTFAVESTLGSVIPPDGKALVVDNGAYGARIVQILERLRIDSAVVGLPETQVVTPDLVRFALETDAAITHVVMVHCETTTGMLNPAAEIGMLAREFDKEFILDAMSSFGGIPIEMLDHGIHYLIASANKCVQGVPGFGFVVARRRTLEQTQGWARSLSLDLHDQWDGMQKGGGKWRYTSPTHALLAFEQALRELSEEGGVAARHARYSENHRVLVDGMRSLGFETLLPDELQAPIITSFLSPSDSNYRFDEFYAALKARRFVIYPGKVSDADTFRIGNIGHVFPDDMLELIGSIRETLEDLGVQM